MSTHAPVAAPPAASETPAVPAAAARAESRSGAVVVVFTTAVFTSAFLLFLVQPMFSKMVLPLLGGTPAVWNTCMLFFQAALLGGYFYAHVGAARLGVIGQARLHLGLLLAAGLMLPIAVSGAAPQGGQAPIPWLLLLMATTVGLPFFVLSGTGPMLQRWYAHTGRADASNPYWLYAASNVGSMLALLGYPFLMEPRLRLVDQSGTWAAGYAVLIVLVAACALAVGRGGEPAAAAPSAGAAEADASAAAPSARERAVWVGLAFVPSSLLLSVTTFITTDLAPVPLLWVLPLALYLLTFTVAFSTRPLLKHAWMVRAEPAVLAGVGLLLMSGFAFIRDPRVVVPLHLFGLFAVGMACHGELARRRPHVRHLTGFYLWISVGGVLGGIVNVLVAPVLFTYTWEYPLVLALACLARPWPARGEARAPAWRGPAAAAACAALMLAVARPEVLPSTPVPLRIAAGLAVAVGVALALGRSPAWLAACVGAAVLAGTAIGLRGDDTVYAVRSFYGRHRVDRSSYDGGYHALYHGSTLHGAQSLRPERRREASSYYIPGSPFAQVLTADAWRAGRRRVAVVGLGTGTTAAYARPGEAWTFYEIDPEVERIARDPRLFTFLADAPAPVDVVLGDARLQMAKAPKAAYDVIVLDAFSSDAVPVHLLTRQAMRMYLEKLAPGGIMVLHMSNRYLDLEPVLSALSITEGLAMRVGTKSLIQPHPFHSASIWAAFARGDGDLAPLDALPNWRGGRLKVGVYAWTDDYSSLWSVFKAEM